MRRAVFPSASVIGAAVWLATVLFGLGLGSRVLLAQRVPEWANLDKEVRHAA